MIEETTRCEWCSKGFSPAGLKCEALYYCSNRCQVEEQKMSAELDLVRMMIKKVPVETAMMEMALSMQRGDSH